MNGQVFVLTSMLLVSGGRLATSEIPTNSPNCNLQSPPPDSGDAMGDEPEFDLKVFPRLVSFPAHYTGCQLSWRRQAQRWQLFSAAYFESGQPVILYGPSVLPGGKADLVCRYNGRKLVAGPPETCPEPSTIALHSMPGGCAQRVRSGAHEPAECEDDSAAR